MMTAAQLQDGLSNFYGSEQFHSGCIMSRKHLLTDGAKFLADNAGAYWLMDAIASYHSKCMKDEMLRDMQFWKLKTDVANKTAVLTCDRDTGNTAIKQVIEHTDFPLPEIKLYCAPSGDGIHYTILLDSEY
jgi:hypothetical protein